MNCCVGVRLTNGLFNSKYMRGTHHLLRSLDTQWQAAKRVRSKRS